MNLAEAKKETDFEKQSSEKANQKAKPMNKQFSEFFERLDLVAELSPELVVEQVEAWLLF